MSTATLFDLTDFAPPAPTWAEECCYCVPGTDGTYDMQNHLRSHLELTCTVCGGVSPNRTLFVLDHGINLGGSWERDARMCTTLELCLNHLTYAWRNGEEPSARDLEVVLGAGWLVGPVAGDGVPPVGWPSGETATSCSVALAVEVGQVATW